MSCSVQNCQGVLYARGWCRKHYRHVVESGHKEPFSAITADDKIGIERVSHYSNLQPLTIEENCSKATQDKLWKN